MGQQFHSLLQQVLHDTYKTTHDIEATKKLFRTSVEASLSNHRDNDLDIKTIIWLSQTMAEILQYDKTKHTTTTPNPNTEDVQGKSYCYQNNGKFFCPVVRGISSSGMKYDRPGKYAKPITGEFECTEPCMIISIESLPNGLIKVYYDYANMVAVNVVDYYPVKDDIIDKMFFGEANTIVHELVNYYKSLKK